MIHKRMHDNTRLWFELQTLLLRCPSHDGPKMAPLVTMTKIAFRARQSLLQRARLVARARHTTLNAAFREWLEQHATHAGGGAAVDALMCRLRQVRASGAYTRDEMNER